MAYLLTAVPILEVANLDTAVSYYQERLGFDLTWTWGDPPAVAGLTRDEVELCLAAAGGGKPRAPGRVYVRLADVDEYYEECRRRGATIVRQPADQPQGFRDFAVIDLDGNRLEFGEAIVE